MKQTLHTFKGAFNNYVDQILPNFDPLTPSGGQTWTFYIKFGLSEKHTKFEKIFLMVLTNQLIYLVNVKTMRKIFFKLCVLLKKSKFYHLSFVTWTPVDFLLTTSSPPPFFHVVIECPLRLIESTALIKAPFLSHLQRAVWHPKGQSINSAPSSWSKSRCKKST